MTKPFSPRELSARVRAMLRRPRSTRATPEQNPQERTFGPLTVDPQVARCGWTESRSH